MQGIPMSLGRDFSPEEDQPGKDRVLIMTHRFWQERFGSDTHIIGQQVRLHGEPYSVVGVLAAGMSDRFESHLFVPLSFKPDQINHDSRRLTVMGRLKPGITLQQANADMNSVALHIAETFPASNKGWGATVRNR
jgi:putative ABC transport system permease protein